MIGGEIFRLVLLLGLLCGPDSLGQSPVQEVFSPEQILCRKTTKVVRYYGFNEFVRTGTDAALPKKYARLTWDGSIKESSTQAAIGTQRTVFAGSFVFTGALAQNDLVRREYRNLDTPSSEGSGTGGTYEIEGFSGGGCLPIRRHNLLNEFAGTPMISLPVLTAPPVMTPLGREIQGKLQLDWDDVHLPCNTRDFGIFADTFETGPVAETLSEPVPGIADPVMVDSWFELDPDSSPIGGTVIARKQWYFDRMGRNSSWSPLSTSPLIFEDVSFEIKAKFRGLCGSGTRQAILFVQTPAGEDPGHIEEIPVTANLITSPDGLTEVDVVLSVSRLGDSASFGRLVLESTSGECAQCSTLAGTPAHSVGSVDWRMELGRLANGSSTGVLRLHAREFWPALYTPASLAFSRPAQPNPDLVMVRRSGGSLRQIQTGSFVVDIVSPAEDSSLAAKSYEVRFFAQAGSTPSPADPALLVPGAPAIHATRFFDPDGTGRGLAIIRYGSSFGQPISSIPYEFDAATNRWSLTEEGLRRTDKTTVALSSDEEEITTTVWDISSGTPRLNFKVTERVQLNFDIRFFSGPFAASDVPCRFMTRQVLDPDGSALESLWEFEGFSAVREVSMRRYDGSWRRRDLDFESLPIFRFGPPVFPTITPFGNADFAGTQGVVRTMLDQLSWEDIPDLDGDAQPEKQKIRSEQIDGVTLSMVVTQELSAGSIQDGQPVVVTRRARLLYPNESVAAPGVRWEVIKTVHGGPNAGRVVYRLDTAGTLELTSFNVSASTGEVTETSVKGGANATDDAVLAGRRTMVVTNRAGGLVSRVVQDVVSGVTIEHQQVLAYDNVGSPTTIAWLDGSIEQRQNSACCGRLESVSRHGVTTTYAYDSLGRKAAETTAGISLRYSYDAMDHVVKTVRRGLDGSEMVLSTVTYDLAGRVTSTTDAGGGRTVFAVVYSADGTTTRTTTLPDAATVIEVTNRDGTLGSRSGTSISPTFWSYQVVNDGSVAPLITTENRAAAESVATEWIKTSHDGANRVRRVTFADGASESYDYNDRDQLARHVDPDGITTLFAYNALGELEVTAIDVNGNGAINYAGIDRVAKTVRATELKTEGAVSHAVQRTTSQAWETEDQDVAVTTSVSEQSADGLRMWTTLRGLTTTILTSYDGVGGRTTTTNGPDGVQTVQTYRVDQLVSAVTKTATGSPLSSTAFAYDPHGRLVSRTEARNGATVYSYYDDDRLRSVTTPDPDPTRAGPGYDSQTTEYAYDAIGRVLTVTQPDGGVINTTYYPTGAVKRTWGARTYPVEYAYDALGRLKTMTTWQDFAADAGKAATTWNYDPARGFLLNKRYADNTGPSYTYKPSGRLLTRAWARTPAIIATYSYNGAGELAATDYSDNTPDITIAYDRAGRPKTITDGSGTRAIVYHASSQAEHEIYTAGLLNGLGVDRVFDSLSRVSGSGGPSLPSATYAYDAASRLQAVVSGPDTATYAYGANSSLVESVTFANGGATRLRTTKVYDKLNRLSTVNSQLSTGTALNHGYTYDAANQRTRATREELPAAAGNSYWSYGYDALGQVTGGSKFLANGTPALGLDYRYSYDHIGNRKTATVNAQTSSFTPNTLNQYVQRTVPGAVDVLGAAASGATVTVTVDNGPAQPVARQEERFFGQIPVDNFAAGRYPSLKVIGARNLVGPNGEDAVTEVTRSAYVPKTPEGFTYDADGNLTDDARWHYTWDGENRVSAIETGTLAAGVGVRRQKLDFAYDGQSRRVAKKVSNWNGSTWVLASHTLFAYDGWNLLAELAVSAMSTPTLIRSYTWGLDFSGTRQAAGGVGGLLAVTDLSALSSPPSALPLSPSTHFPAFDGNGNVAALVRATDGAVSASYDYTPFGETIMTDGPYANANPFRFSTKYTDAETGHLYYGYRCYAPEMGRWLSRDPLEEDGGANLYGFVRNNPTNEVDPSGLWPTPIHNQIIDEAFAAFPLIDREIQILKDTSRNADAMMIPNRGQAMRNSYKHSMRAPYQSAEDAQAKARQYITQHLAKARGLQDAWRAKGNCGYSPDALREFGYALHTLTDSTSPSHAGAQPWNPGNIVDVIRHVHGEASISPEQIHSTADLARRYFGIVFK